MDWTIILKFWPLILLQIILLILALLDLRKRKKLNHLSRSVWILVIVLFNLFGPILYFIIGRGEE